MSDGLQLALELGEFLRAPTAKAEGATIQERFESFHQLNPHVYSALCSIARRMKSQGHRRVGMKGLFEFLRVTKGLHTTGDDFKLNNNYTSRYARLIADQEDDLRSLFEFRERKAA